MTWSLEIWCRKCPSKIIRETLTLEHAEFMLDHAANNPGHSEFAWGITTRVAAELFSSERAGERNEKKVSTSTT